MPNPITAMTTMMTTTAELELFCGGPGPYISAFDITLVLQMAS
jgi:hypothetical protein